MKVSRLRLLAFKALVAADAGAHRTPPSPVIDANTSAVASASAKDRTHGKGSCQRLVKKTSFFDTEGHCANDYVRRVLLLAGWKKISREMSIGVGTLYRLAAEGSKIREMVF